MYIIINKIFIYIIYLLCYIRDELPGHIHEFFQRNYKWKNIHICDNTCKDEFMNTIFANTSVQWAYSLINMAYAASKADLWRYAVLYTYGGMYIDDDSDIKVPLDEVYLFSYSYL